VHPVTMWCSSPHIRWVSVSSELVSAVYMSAHTTRARLEKQQQDGEQGHNTEFPTSNTNKIIMCWISAPFIYCIYSRGTGEQTR